MSEQVKRLLIVEDDPGLQSQLRWSFEDYEVGLATDRESAIAQLRRMEPSVVTLDLGLPPDPGGVSEGFATLEEILRLTPDTKVIVVTGHNDWSNAVQSSRIRCLRLLARSLLSRSYWHWSWTGLPGCIAWSRRIASWQWKSISPLDGIVAVSPEMLKVCRTIEKLAPTDVSTLILGRVVLARRYWLKRCMH